METIRNFENPQILIDQYLKGIPLNQISINNNVQLKSLIRYLIRKNLKAPNNSKFSKDEEKKIKELINNNKSIRSIAVTLKCSREKLDNYLKNNKLGANGKNARKYPLIENYFEFIDTPDKAYLLGLIYADGCIRKNRDVFQINLTDLEMMNTIKNILCPDKPLYDHDRNRPLHHKKALRLEINSKKLKDDLIRHGCIVQKSKYLANFPKISKSFFPDFIRGFFDGDGCVTYPKTDFKSIQISFKGTKPFLQNVQKMLKNFDRGLDGSLSAATSLKENINQNYGLNYGGYNQVKQLFKIMYGNLIGDSSGSLFLNRKYLIFINYFRIYDSKKQIKSIPKKIVSKNRLDKVQYFG